MSCRKLDQHQHRLTVYTDFSAFVYVSTLLGDAPHEVVFIDAQGLTAPRRYLQRFLGAIWRRDGCLL